MLIAQDELRKMPEPNFESYPPLFRPTQAIDHPNQPTKQTPDSDPLPVIDLEHINHDMLSEACKDWGIFRLVNYGIPMNLLNQLHDLAKKLFSLNFETKQALFTGPVAYFWGTPALTPSGSVLQRGPKAQNINWLEGFNVLLCKLSQLQFEDPMLESFRVVMEEYGSHQARVATKIFQAIAENLNLGPKESKSHLSPSTGSIRVHRYPPCSEANQAWGVDAHTDSSVLSLLDQDEVGGLQFHKDQKWFNVKPVPNTLVVHLGDMTQAISDDKYKSVKHRVKVNKHADRISIGYFVFPAEDSVIRSSRYKPFTYNDFRAQVQEDLKTNGLKVGLERFKVI